MKTLYSIALLLIFAINVFAQQSGYTPELFSRAEKTNFAETSLSSDVRSFVNKLDELSDLVTVETFGHSFGGQELQLVIMANPGISSPEEAKASGKTVVYIQANIHAGEVEGKEATIKLMREIAFEYKTYLLDNQIILFCPNYNPDGNDKLSETNRRSQGGSPLLTGERSNGEGYDLNREGIKMEALEAKALVKNVFNRWDPALFVDLHTDNGSWHGYALNFAPSFNSVGHPGPTLLTKNELLPWVEKSVWERTGVALWWHGYLRMREGQQARFTGYSHLPRYVANYVGLRNRMGILSETFAHQIFEKRIVATYLLVESVLNYTNDHAKEILETVKKADLETVETILTQAGKIKKGVRFQLTEEPELVEILVRETETYEDANGRRRMRETGKIRWADSVMHYNSFVPVVSSTVPRYYYFPSKLAAIADKLKEHGIRVDQLSKRNSVEGEVFKITEFKKDQRSRYPGHNPVSLEGEFISKKKTFKSGDYRVDLAQPLAWLIFYMMEPQSDDGLVYWNYFDEYLESKKAGEKEVEFPVLKAY